MSTSFLHSMHSTVSAATAVHFLALRVRIEPNAHHVINMPHPQREMVYKINGKAQNVHTADLG